MAHTTKLGPDDSWNHPDDMMLPSITKWRAARLSGAGLVVASITVAAMVLLAIAVSLWQYRLEVEARALLTGRAMVASVEAQLRAQFESYDTALRLVIANFADPSLRMLDDDIWRLLLSNIQKSDTAIISITVVGPGGRVLARQGATEDINFTDMPFFKAHQARAGLGLMISDPVDGEKGKQTVVLSRRIVRSDGSFGGVAAMVVDLSAIDAMLASIPLGPSDSITIVSGDGRIMARKPYLGRDVHTEVNQAPNANVQRMQTLGRGNFVSRSALDGIERLFTFDQVEEARMLVTVGLGTKALYANWQRQALFIAALALAIGAALVIAAVMLARESRLRLEAQSELEKQARTDFLTGLPNRRQFDANLDREWRRAARTGADLAVILFDADHFKQFNDRHGHALGDQVLKLIASSLARSARRPGDLPARIGGEEFAMLLSDTTAEGAVIVAERIRVQLKEQTSKTGGGLASVTLSAGVADTTGRSAGSTAADLIAAADSALYLAKERGRDRIERAAG